MLKLALSLPLAAAILALPAQAEIVFKGRAVVTAVTACPDYSVGDSFNATFHPASVPGATQAENVSALNVFYNYGAQFNTLAGANFTSSFQTTQNGGEGWSDYTASVTSAVRVISVTPAITATTASVVIDAEVQNIEGDPGQTSCVIRLTIPAIKG